MLNLRLPEWSRRDWRRDVETVSWIAIVGSAGLAIAQLYQASEFRRVGAALDFAERFSEEPLSGYQRELNSRWLVHGASLEKLKGTGIPPEGHVVVLQMALGEGGAGALTDSDAAILELTDALDQLGICWLEAHCDRDAVDAYFCDYAANFASLYAPVIDHLRGRIAHEELGKKLGAYVEETECSA